MSRISLQNYRFEIVKESCGHTMEKKEVGLRRKHWTPYLLTILIAIALGIMPTIIIRNQFSQYGNLDLPWLSLPMWGFLMVWTLLLIVLGWSMARVWQEKSKERKKAAVFYAVQLFMNVFWMVLFFQWHIYLLSFFWFLALTLTAANMVEKFRIVSEAAANIQIPYIAWLVYALYFNFGVYLLNGAPVSL